MTDDDQQTVWVPARGNGGEREVYHTDRDCQYVRRADCREVPLQAYEGHKRECQACAGERQSPSGGGTTHMHDIALRLDPEEVFGDA